MSQRGLFRVNYYGIGGQPKTAFVVADTDTEAGIFMGVSENSGVQITRDRFPVEVAGLDPAHDVVPGIPPSVAPFDSPKGVSRQEFDALQAQLAEFEKKLNAKNTPASPAPTTSGEPTPVQPGPTAAKE